MRRRHEPSGMTMWVLTFMVLALVVGYGIRGTMEHVQRTMATIETAMR